LALWKQEPSERFALAPLESCGEERLFVTEKAYVAETQTRLLPKQTHESVRISPTFWITLSVGNEKNPGLPRRNTLRIEGPQNFLGEAIDEQRMAGSDVVVVN